MKYPTPAEFYNKIIEKDGLSTLCRPADEDEEILPSTVGRALAALTKSYALPPQTTLDEIIDTVEYALHCTYNDAYKLLNNKGYSLNRIEWALGGVAGILEIRTYVYDDTIEIELSFKPKWGVADSPHPDESIQLVTELHNLFRKDVNHWLASEGKQGTLWKCEIYYTGDPGNRYTTDSVVGERNSCTLYKGCDTIPGGLAISNGSWTFEIASRWWSTTHDESIQKILESPITDWKLATYYDYVRVRDFAESVGFPVFEIPEWVEIKERYLNCSIDLMGSHYATLADKVVYGDCALAVNALGKLLDKWNWWNGESYQFGLDGENDDANCLYNINVWHDYDPESDEYEECEEIGYTYTSDHQYDNLLTCDGELPEDFYYVYRDLVKDLSQEHVDAMGDWLSKYDCIDVSRCRDGWAYRVDHQLVIYETKHEDGTSTYRLAVEEMDD